MKTIAYGFTKDSTLLAFEGPEKPDPDDEVYKSIHHSGGTYALNLLSYNREMSTTRESALPVMNASCMCKYESEALLFYIDKERIKIGPGETVALPGWALEKVHLNAFFNEEKNEHVLDYAYRLVRSEPEKSLRERISEGECISERGTDHCPVCIDSCDAAHHKRNIEELIEKPDNSAHSFTEVSDCGGDNVIVNPVVEPSESQEDILRDLFQQLYDCLERGKGTMKNITGKFTITRK